MAVGASLGLLTAACETVSQASPPTGVITGNVDPGRYIRSVTAVSESGQTYQAKVLRDGSFRFKPLPYGAYALKFVDDCGGSVEASVNLKESGHAVLAPSSPANCVVVGRLEVDRRQRLVAHLDLPQTP